MHNHTRANENGWNFIFSIFFIAVLIGAVSLVKQQTGYYLMSATPFDVLLMSLASFRITRLIVYDKISRWFRDLFVAESGFRHTVGDLLSCPWCIGFWSALIIVVAYAVYDWAWMVILFLAIAGAGSFIQLLANGIGWRAEQLKLDVKDKEIDRTSLGS